MSRLTIDISEQQHQSLKALAALQGKTIKQYAIERLFPGNIDNDPAWQELRGVLTARINDGLAGKVSDRSIGDILDEELSGESRACAVPTFSRLRLKPTCAGSSATRANSGVTSRCVCISADWNAGSRALRPVKARTGT